jgi:hypothetical protein
MHLIIQFLNVIHRISTHLHIPFHLITKIIYAIILKENSTKFIYTQNVPQFIQLIQKNMPFYEHLSNILKIIFTHNSLYLINLHISLFSTNIFR